jgi:hypothetical protein
MQRTSLPAFEHPFAAVAVNGEVALLGPSHICGSMTPEAARRSGERMIAAADEAVAQQEKLQR